MSFEEASRKNIRMKMALCGKAGSGKTYGALMIAKGLVNDMTAVGVIQTESGRAECYLKEFPGFKVSSLKPPFSPEAFVKAITEAETIGLKVLIIDSISDEWTGTGGILADFDKAKAVAKSSYTCWAKLTPRHDALFAKILNSPIHILSTIRKKTDIILEKDSKGKLVPRKVGLKDIQRDDGEYKWMLQLDLNNENMACAVKDNTSLFQGQEFKISTETGAKIRDWCLN